MKPEVLLRSSFFVPTNPTVRRAARSVGIQSTSSPRSMLPDRAGGGDPNPVSRFTEPKYFIAQASGREKSASSSKSTTGCAAAVAPGSKAQARERIHLILLSTENLTNRGETRN